MLIRSPRYAALTDPVPLKLKEIQQEALDQDTLLLEYELGEEAELSLGRHAGFSPRLHAAPAR